MGLKAAWHELVSSYIATLVLAEPDTEADTISRLIPVACAAGVERILVVANKADLRPAWREGILLLDALVSHETTHGVVKIPSAVPVSALKGTNLATSGNDREEYRGLYRGPSLLASLQGMIDTIPKPVDSMSPLRFCVRIVKHSRSVDPKRGGPELGPDEALVTGTIMSGFICEGDELAIAPLGITGVKVVQIRQGHKAAHVVYGPRSTASLLLRFSPRSFAGLEDLPELPSDHISWFKKKYMRRGVVLGRDGEIEATRTVSSFVAAVSVIRRTIRNGYEGVVHAHTLSAPCKWELLQELGQTQPLKEVRVGAWAMVRMRPLVPAYVEEHSSLGRIATFENDLLDTSGQVMSVELDPEPALPLYLRVRKPRHRKQGKIGTVIITVIDGEIHLPGESTPQNVVVRIVSRCKCSRNPPVNFTSTSVLWPAKETEGQEATCNPFWNESLSFHNVDVSQEWFWLQLAEKDNTPNRGLVVYGQATPVTLSALLSCKRRPLRRQLRMPNDRNGTADSYLTISLEFISNSRVANSSHH